MGRIRTIKPGFFRSESLSRCTLEARLMFAGLWTEADDMGRGDATPRLLATALWPWDNPTDDEIAGWLDELVDTDHIQLYQHRDKTLFQVLRWAEHQSSAFRRGTSTFPEPPTPSGQGTTGSPVCNILQDSASDGVQESAYETRQDVDRSGGDRRQTAPSGRAADSDEAASVVGRSVAIYAQHVYDANPSACRTNPQRFMAGVARNASKDRAAELDAYLAAHPDATAEELAAHVLKVPGLSVPQSEPRRDWYADPTCATCDGDGMANSAPEGTPATYGPCACRRAEPYMATIHELHPTGDVA